MFLFFILLGFFIWFQFLYRAGLRGSALSRDPFGTSGV